MELKNNPFQLHDVIFRLNTHQLKVLITLLKSSNPSMEDESFLVQLVTGLEQTLDHIENK